MKSDLKLYSYEMHKNKKKGGYMLSSGSYGCVYSPPLSCDIEPSKKPAKTDISKIFATPEDAEAEWKQSVILKTIDPKQKFFIYPYIQCATSTQTIRANEKPDNPCPLLEELAEQKNQYMQLISNNGGIPMYDYMADKKKAFSPITFIEYIKLLIYIVKGIELLNGMGYVHHDIKPNNILIDEKGIPHIIDLGFLMNVKDIPSRNNPFLEKNYWIHPPEYWIYKERLNDEPITLYKKNTFIIERLNQFNSVFSDKDTSNIAFWYTKYWSSLREIEEEYIRAFSNRDALETQMNTPSYALYVDAYSIGIMMVYMIQFTKEISEDAFVSSELFKQYIDIVRGATHPYVQKRYNISKILKLLKTLIK